MKSLVLSMILAGFVTQTDPQATDSQATDPQATETTSVPQPQPTIKIGEVTGANVYVRSGPSTNYYAVLRLGMGTRVIIIDRRPAWLGIAPPGGAYSLVAKQYVDPDGPDKGVINGDRVWVRAGGELSDATYAKQTRLDRGASVTILGEVEQHYKITPPKGAKLWISADYVRVLEGQAAQTAEESPVPAPESVVTQTLPSPPSTKGIENDQVQKLIEVIEADLEREFEKDIHERNLQQFVDRFTPIAERDDDGVAQHYARYRIGQLARTMKHAESLKKIEELASRLRENRSRFLQERSKIHPVVIGMTRDFAVRGKFVTSAAYSSPVGPRRYRIIESNNPGKIPKTIAYVEIDPQSEIDPQAFLGRHVGVRARGERLLEGSVDPVVIYTAAEIVVLEEVPEDEEQ